MFLEGLLLDKVDAVNNKKLARYEARMEQDCALTALKILLRVALFNFIYVRFEIC